MRILFKHMISKKSIVLICFLCIQLFALKHLFAIGIGVSLTGGTGIATPALRPSAKSAIDYNTGAGFVLDTSVARERRLNYRLYIGYENVIDSGTKFYTNWALHRISLSNTLGFKLWSNKFFRVWMGPQVALSYKFNKVRIAEHDFFTGSYFKYLDTYELKQFVVNLGGVAGTNCNIGELFTISFELGMQAGMGFGAYKYKETSVIVTGPVLLLYPPSTLSYDRGFGKIEVFARLSFIFRINDVYSSRKEDRVNIKLEKKD